MTLLALSQPDFNTLSLVTIVFMVVVFGPRFFRASTAKAREQEMQRTIETYKDAVEAYEKQETANADEIARLREDVRRCHTAAAEWEARYHEQAKYTAKDALNLVAGELAASREAMTGGFAAQGELVLKTIELQTQTLEAVRALKHAA